MIGGLRIRMILASAVVTGISLFAVGAEAQMQLPGATNGVPAGGTPKPARTGNGEATPRGVKPVLLKAPSIDSIVGRALSLDGDKGAMMFDRAGADLVLTKLTLAGDKISKPGQACTIDVAMTTRVVTTDAGHPAGTQRLDVLIAACPFSIDVLDGAVLVSRPDPSCDFTAADCRITPGGLWGPPAAEITPKQIKDLERERQRIETTMRANFRALMSRAGKDRVAVKAIAHEQAAFSSDREMTCRDYKSESVHGFCSMQITQARALALLAKFAAAPVPEQRRAVRAKRSRKPAPGAPAVTSGADDAAR